MMKSTKIGMKDELVINSVKAEPSSVLLGPSSKITALVVDDDTLNQMIHRRLLDGLGVQNQVVGNGKEAVDVHSSGKSFDLILMDKDMPVMNGIEVRTYICSITKVSMEKIMQIILMIILFPYFNLFIINDRQRENSALWGFVV
jgi:response regulator RpfG family c-di-GMP phosphodiesterase